jgi:hypothetical protein
VEGDDGVRRAQRPSKRPVEWPFWSDPVDDWGKQDRGHQKARFEMLAFQVVDIEVPGKPTFHHEPYLGRGGEQIRLLRLRCGGFDCGIDVGAVYCVPVQHRGDPFTWVECHSADERQAGAPTSMRIFEMVIDDVSAHLRIEAECATHGLVARPVAELMEELPRAMTKWHTKRKPGQFRLSPMREA